MHRDAAMPAESAFEKTPIKREEEEILAGLTAPRKRLPCKFFYDETGSKLFEEITRLEEYYPSRAEKAILERYAGELMEGAEGASLVEIGSGDCSKISILLRALPRETLRMVTYVPVDVSESAMEASRCQLERRFGAIEVRGIVADFMHQMHLVSPYENRIFCFFGSTIGNLERQDAFQFVRRLGSLMQRGERLLLGLDMVKERDVLERAYNDAKDVTARFNKNILRVANRTIGTDFAPEEFRHRAFFDEEKQRVEMHLVAARDVTVTSPWFEAELEIREGETIHTENSHKFTEDDIRGFAARGGFSVRGVYADGNAWFTLVDYVK
jgi:L-histidine N-alpha-methyltransferase